MGRRLQADCVWPYPVVSGEPKAGMRAPEAVPDPMASILQPAWLWPHQGPHIVEGPQFLAKTCKGVIIAGMVKLDVWRKKSIVTLDYGAMRSKEKPRS